MKRTALGILWLAVAVQVLWIVLRHYRNGVGIRSLSYVIVVSAAFAVLAVTQGRVGWIAAVLRMFIGLAFVSAVCDRLGLFGGPGSPGVSWGSFHRFVLYTGQVNSFLPRLLIPSLAVIETAIEGSIGIAMLIGWRIRITTWASTLLLSAFLVAMTVSLGLASQFPYGVLVMAAGAGVLAVSDASLFSTDRFLERLEERRRSKGTLNR